MGQIANVRQVTKEVGGRVITFRSLLEYRWAQWLEFERRIGEILEWDYEVDVVKLKTRVLKNTKLYIPDFGALMPDETYEIHECKGYFQPKDYGKLKLAAEQYENPITLIFANLKSDSKCKKTRAQYNRAKRLEPFLKRIIYHANRDYFKKIGIM